MILSRLPMLRVAPWAWSGQAGVGGGRGVGCGSVVAVSSVGLGGVGPCVGDGAPEWVVVVVGVGSTSGCD